MSDLPHIETFEYDISEEIKKKEANIGDIASASGTIENKPDRRKPSSPFLVILSIIFLFLSIAGVIWYMIYVQNQESPISQQVKNLSNLTSATNTSTTSLEGALPSLNTNVGRFISKIEKTSTGYDLTISDYAQVFGFVIKNEKLFAVDSAKLFNIEISAEDIFSDETISNQNMRVLNTASSTIAYAFVNNNHLILSTSTEGLIKMRNAIIK